MTSMTYTKLIEAWARGCFSACGTFLAWHKARGPTRSRTSFMESNGVRDLVQLLAKTLSLTKVKPSWRMIQSVPYSESKFQTLPSFHNPEGRDTILSSLFHLLPHRAQVYPLSQNLA